MADLKRSPGGGLVNPLIDDPKLHEPAPGERPAYVAPEASVGEPSWQRLLSVIVILLITFLWVLPLLFQIFFGK